MAFDEYIQTHHLTETPVVPLETWCPECGGPPENDRAALAYCMNHMPVAHGESDRLVEPGAYVFATEAGGAENVSACNLIHRRTT
jgi:hypothetical protein